MLSLESDRLKMRNYKESNLPEYHRMMSDKVNMYYLADLITNSIEESYDSLKKTIEANAGENCRRYCITLKDVDKLIGAVGYEIPCKTSLGNTADPMGWFLMPEYQNQGYMTEAVKRLLKFAFLQDNCLRVVTACFKQNIPTQKVMSKAGFKIQAEKTSVMWLDGQMRDRLEFVINKDEFMQIHGVVS